MIDLYAPLDLATRATRAVAGSARPDAPVVTEARRRHRTRARAAATLHRIASALEPADAQDRRVRVRPSAAHQ